MSVLCVPYTSARKGYSLLSHFYKLAPYLLWGLCILMSIFKKCVCLYAASLKRQHRDFKLVLIAKKVAAKLNSLPKGKIAVNVTPSPVNTEDNSSLVS